MVEIYFPKTISLFIGMLFIATSLHSQIYVDSSATGANNGSDWTNAFNDLQDALDAACADLNLAEIWVAAGTYYPTSNSIDRDATFQLCNDVAIYGGFTGTETMLTERVWETNETILSGDINGSGTHAGNSYTVVTGSGTNATAVIDGFTVTMGNSNSTSGSITNPDLSGGGMYNNNGSPTVTNSTFSGNEAGYRGGGMYNVENSSPTVTNSTFSGNEADFGGGMFNWDNSSPTITNCTFSGNEAIEGGGMYNDENSSPMVTNSTFSGNEANEGGGMYNLFNSSPTITNCIIWNNSAGGNTASASASVNNNITSNPAFSYSLIANSGGSGSWDSAIGMDGGNNIDADPLFVEDVDLGSVPTTSGNLQLQACSPAIDAGNPDTTGLNLPATDLAGNPRIVNDIIDMGAYEQGGLPCGLECPEGTIVYVKEGGAGDGSSWADATGFLQDALEMGCGCYNITQIWIAQGTYYPDDGMFVNNNDRDATFQLCNEVQLLGGFPDTGDPTLSDRDWETNETILSGDINQSGTLVGNSYSVVTGSGTDNTAVIDGIIITMGNADVASSNFNNPNRSGGGMYTNSGSPTITNCTFSGNSANKRGGGMFNWENSSPTVTNSTFSGNEANDGGGMSNFNNSSPTVTNCTFSGNEATNGGGGMFNFNNSSPTVTNCTYSGNSAGIWGGGMVSAFDSSPTVTNSTFSGNSASQGGGMYNQDNSSPMITNCTFSGNSASQGGGMHNFISSSPTVTNSTFSGNSASPGGGMFNWDNSSPTVTNCTFSGNTANGNGGGMFNRFDSSPTVTNCIFSGNTANGDGGGMFNRDNSSTITNCTFSGNVANNVGGGMFNRENSSPTVTNCTFSGNVATNAGGGMFNWDNSSPTVTNSIIWNNSADGNITSAFASVFNSGSNPEFSYSLIANSGGSGSWDSDIGMDGGNNIDADPLFVAPLTPGLNTGGDYRLQDCSPAINAGSNDAVPSGVTTDLDGNPRFFNSGVVDLGAYEFQGFTPQPEIICLNQTIVFNGESDILLNGEDMVEIIEICGEADFSLSQTAISCEQIDQVISVEVIVTDLFNNTATCTSQITVTGLPCGFTQNPDGVNCTNGNEVTFNPTTEEWIVTSTNCYYASPFNSDATAFAQHTLCGNGSIIAQVTGISGTALGWAGVVMRETNAAGAKKAQLTTNLSNFSRREFRTVTNGSAFPQQFLSFNRYWLRLTRTGNQFIMEVSPNGINWFFAGAQNIVMNSCIEVGLVVTNYNSNSTVTGTFANVSVTGSMLLPPGNDSDPTLLVNYDNQQVLREVNVYPNPTSGELNIALTGYEGRPVTLEVYNTIGQIIFIKEINEVLSTDEIIDLSSVASGMYLIRVTSEGLPAEMKRVMVAR